MASYAHKEVTRKVAKITRTFLNLYGNIEKLNEEIARTGNRSFLRNFSNTIQENIQSLDTDQQMCIKYLYEGNDQDLYHARVYLDYTNNLLSTYDNILRFLASELEIRLPNPLFD